MKRYMTIHYGDIAGLPYLNAIALRRQGINSISIRPLQKEIGGYPGGVSLSNRQLPSDRVLYHANDTKLKRIMRRIRFIAECFSKAEIMHYYGTTITASRLDSKLFDLFGIPTIVTWAGTEARIVAQARAKNPYFHREMDAAWDRIVMNKLESFAKYVHYVATDPELAEYSVQYFKKVFILPQPVNIAECPEPESRNKNAKIVVLHIPTHQEIKGTKYIQKAIERLTSEGINFQFQLLDPIYTQKQMKRMIADCDIYIDELRCGAYGQTAVESMACGKPTITYIREDLIEKYPSDLPIVNANPDTIYDRLKLLLLDKELRYEIGRKSRIYAEKTHSLDVVGKRLIQIYREIGFKK